MPDSARRAARVLAVSERTNDDLVELYGVDPQRIIVTPLGVDPDSVPGAARGSYLLLVGAVQPRKDPLAAADAAAVGDSTRRRRADSGAGLVHALRGAAPTSADT